MASEKERDVASPSHQRPPFADPLAGGIDPTAPGAPHEPGGEATNQSQGRNADAPGASRPDWKEPRPGTQPEPPKAA